MPIDKATRNSRGIISSEFKKSGANFLDRNAIKALSEAGHEPEYISDAIGVCLSVVKAFVTPSKSSPSAAPRVQSPKSEPVEVDDDDGVADTTAPSVADTSPGARARARRKRPVEA